MRTRLDQGSLDGVLGIRPKASQPGCCGSALTLGAQESERVVDALFEDVVGELLVGHGAGDLEHPDHQGEDVASSARATARSRLRKSFGDTCRLSTATTRKAAVHRRRSSTKSPAHPTR